jgi:hypothetical protein
MMSSSSGLRRVINPYCRVGTSVGHQIIAKVSHLFIHLNSVQVETKL